MSLVRGGRGPAGVVVGPLARTKYGVDASSVPTGYLLWQRLFFFVDVNPPHSLMRTVRARPPGTYSCVPTPASSRWGGGPGFDSLSVWAKLILVPSCIIAGRPSFPAQGPRPGRSFARPAPGSGREQSKQGKQGDCDCPQQPNQPPPTQDATRRCQPTATDGPAHKLGCFVRALVGLRIRRILASVIVLFARRCTVSFARGGGPSANQPKDN